ncbi:MAG: hypothetical protein SFT81_02645 [Candidatus Caenarcaniphilales bacterium]|nr:hypothetical protein [Candidatus Caenarcaniphilales bacterium]
MRDDRERLLDIMESIEKIQKNYHSKLVELSELEIYGILHLLQIIGEASNKLSLELKQRYKDIAW